MSFRLRVLALVVLVGATATAATAWLTLRQASQQIVESEVAEGTTISRITDALTEYGRAHGTWEGVVQLVAELAVITDQRIRLVADHGEVLVDTDHLEGRSARPTASPPIRVDPRPTLELEPQIEDPAAATQQAVRTYRHQVILTACLTRLGIEMRHAGAWPQSIPRYVPDLGGQPDSDATEDAYVAACASDAAVYNERPLLEAYELCRGAEAAEDHEQHICLQSAFTREISAFAPVPLNLYLGAYDDDPPSPLASGPALAAAGLVAPLAIGGALLISRRVLRPLRLFTRTARQFAAGDLTGRVPVIGNDELAGFARVFNQMADSLQREEERQRRLVADVAHELRTPLANLRGYLEGLKDGVVAPERDLFESLHEEAVLQQRIVDDLQDLALAEAGALAYHWSEVDLAELLESCRTAHQSAADAAEVGLVVSAPRSVPVRLDPDRFRQVIGNLVINALRATGAGGSIRLGARRSGPAAVITVADTGTGIAPNDLPHVFDRFWRADAARGRGTGGRGLGLAITRQIVTDHGGRIDVASRLGTGTTFTITVPAGAATPPDGTR